MAAPGDVGLSERQRPALSDLELQPHTIDAGHALGHRMLDLDARVHLEKIELAVARQEELDRSGADIADRRGRLDRRRAHRGAQLGCRRRRRRFLDQLLMAALDRAVALAEMNDRALLVAEHLDLDVPRAEKRALEEEPPVAESALGLGVRGRERGFQPVGLAHDAHAASPASGGGFDHDRIADAVGLIGEPRGTLIFAMVAWGAGDACGLHPRLGGGLVAHRADRRGGRPDEDEAGGRASVGEIGALGEKTVAWMDGVGGGRFRGVDERPDRQIGLRRGARRRFAPKRRRAGHAAPRRRRR